MNKNRNLDIFVLDCTIVIVRKTPVFTYISNVSYVEGSFTPYSITTDSQSNILAADSLKSNVFTSWLRSDSSRSATLRTVAYIWLIYGDNIKKMNKIQLFH